MPDLLDSARDHGPVAFEHPPIASLVVAGLPPPRLADAAALHPAPNVTSTTTLLTGPSAIFSADPTFAPIMPSIPALPTVPSVPAVNSSPATSRPTAVPLTLEDLTGQPSTSSGIGQAVRKGARSVVRSIVRLLMLAALIAAGYGAYRYGPGLYDEYVRGEDPSAVPETDAPLAFPVETIDPLAVPAPIRTAEFVLEGLPGSPGVTYRVTTDFETKVSQVDVTRDVGPDLQILTYGDAAFIRRAESNQWYELERGQFPLDDRLERVDWVRRLEELIPTSVRSTVTIDDSADTTVEGVSTRHLSLTLDISTLGGGTTVDTGTPADAAAAAASVTGNIEVWIDDDGLVRKVSGVPQLGADTITVVRTDSAAWIPQYPDRALVEPLTAATLVELGI